MCPELLRRRTEYSHQSQRQRSHPMTSAHDSRNPLFSSQLSGAAVTVPTSRRSAARAVKFGGYGGMVVAAWLVTAVATGHGVAAADTSKSASDSAGSTSTGVGATKPSS